MGWQNLDGPCPAGGLRSAALLEFRHGYPEPSLASQRWLLGARNGPQYSARKRGGLPELCCCPPDAAPQPCKFPHPGGPLYGLNHNLGRPNWLPRPLLAGPLLRRSNLAG